MPVYTPVEPEVELLSTALLVAYSDYIHKQLNDIRICINSQCLMSCHHEQSGNSDHELVLLRKKLERFSEIHDTVVKELRSRIIISHT